jgi:hypothetical protein
MKLKTLMEYAAEVAKLINGKVIFTGPNSAAIGNTHREITLDGPCVGGWHAYNQQVINLLKKYGESADLASLS